MIQHQADEAPRNIVVSRDRSKLRLSGHDGETQVLGAEALRLSCRCAWCTRDRIVDHFPERFDGIAIANVAPIGGHALHITFSDGHARGIFPWRYLHEIGRGSNGVIPSIEAEPTR